MEDREAANREWSGGCVKVKISDSTKERSLVGLAGRGMRHGHRIGEKLFVGLAGQTSQEGGMDLIPVYVQGTLCANLMTPTI